MPNNEYVTPVSGEAEELAREYWQKVERFPKDILWKLTIWDCRKIDEIIIEYGSALLRSRMERAEQWIPVSERLPRQNEFVHVVIGGIFQLVPARLVEDRWYWFAEADSAPKEVVTHWRPLPSAPDTEKKA